MADGKEYAFDDVGSQESLGVLDQVVTWSAALARLRTTA